MQNYSLSKEVSELFDNNSNLRDYMVNASAEGIIVYEEKNGKVLFVNLVAKRWLGEDNPNADNIDKIEMIGGLIDDDLLVDIKEENHFTFNIGSRIIETQATTVDGTVLLFMRDNTKMITAESELQTLKELNGYLQNVYENYTDDTICITDENGIVEFCGEACERHCGITAKDIIGKNVYELEKERYFYPSATVNVLRSGKSEVVMQNTNIGVVLITIGVPIHEGNKLKKVISISRDFSKEIVMATLLIKNRYETTEDIVEEGEYDKIITCSNMMFSRLALLRMVAKTQSTVLLTGETGTGKGVFAKYIHERSTRANKPFIHVNCGAIPDSIIESELYGYEKGAFTGANAEGKVGLFEVANGGTLFLDEIAEMSMPQQVKLLHALQDKKIRRVGGEKEIALDVRVITATNKNIEEQIEKGEFRRDLYYRINVVSMEIPSLKDRPEDIPLLITHFLNQFNMEYQQNKEISKRAIRKLRGYSWPGNVRELENVVEAIIVTAKDNIIDIDDLPDKIKKNKSSANKNVTISKLGTLEDILRDAEIQAIRQALKEGGNHKKASEILGIDRTTVTRKINKYGIKIVE